MTSAIQANSFVTPDYTLRGDDGEVLDASEGEEGAPIEYVHGYGMLVPGLEAALVGLHAGDERDVVVPAEAGYGDYDEELLMEVDRSEFPDPGEVAVGDELVAEADGDEVTMQVVEVKADVIVVDANHPLAGRTLHYSIKVRAFRDATADEIEKAAADFEAAGEHVHGPGCDHDHDHDPPERLALGKKPRLPN